MKNLALILIGSSVLFGCVEPTEDAKAPETARASEAAEAPDAPVAEHASAKRFGTSTTGARLFREMEASETKYEFGMNHGSGGLGKLTLHVNGKSVWPPKGDGCTGLVECCEALTAIDEPNALGCLMATGHDRTCGVAQQTVNQMSRERGISLPAACSK